MAKYQAIGQIHFIGQTQARPSKNGGEPFLSRQLVLQQVRREQDTDRLLTPNLPCFEFNGIYCKLLDNFRPSQTVLVKFDINGRCFQDEQGQTKYFTTLRAFHIEPYKNTNRDGADKEATEPVATAPVPQPTNEQPISPNPNDELPF